MNRIIFEPQDCVEGRIVLSDVRAEHIRNTLHGVPGQSIKVGLINGGVGTAVISEVTPETVVLSPDELMPDPLEPWFDILLSVPRPRAMKRLWPQLAAMGVRRIRLVRGAKTEKSYLGSHVLSPENYRPLLIDGLMQAGTTQLPEVFPAGFLRDILPVLDNPLKLLAHPGSTRPVLPKIRPTPFIPVLAVGTDGGWTDSEIELLHATGFADFALGPRPLRTDTACIALIGVLESLLSETNRLFRGTD